jgi:hypothetical protein
VVWCGLASGAFVALAADPRATVLSGLYVDAGRDLGELIKDAEKGVGSWRIIYICLRLMSFEFALVNTLW